MGSGEILTRILIGTMAGGVTCDFEECPGQKPNTKKRLMYSPRYLFVHQTCVKSARAAAKGRSEMFGFRHGI